MLRTDFERWTSFARSETHQWEKRARVIASFIRPTDTVLDLGAGQQTLRRHIPRSCGYIAVDCVDMLPGTFVVDFNAEFRLPEQPFNVIVSSGFIEYLEDRPAFMSKLTEACDGKFFICSFYLKPDPLHSVNKPHSLADAEASVSKYVRGLTHVATFSNQPIFAGTLSKAPDDPARLDPLNNLLAPARRRRWYHFGR